MIDAIIFSKNRACQLHLLLESISLRSNGIFGDQYIIYKTDPEFNGGYNKIKEEFPSFIWIEQTDFKQDVLDILRKCHDYVCFFVDDNFFHRIFPLSNSDLNEILETYDLSTLSLRLGKNTIIQNWYNLSKIPLPIEIKNTKHDDIFIWNWQKMPTYTNFGYPFSVDGHIYKKSILCLDYEFDTPNALEGRFDIKHIPSSMGCLGQSVIVNNPLNLVGSSNNLAGQKFGLTLNELETKYVGGQTINLDKLGENEIVACHQEMEIELC